MASGDDDPPGRTHQTGDGAHPEPSLDAAAVSSDEERWLVIDGRRWRRTDPALPDDVAARLRSHLGRARSAVRTTKRAGDDDATAAARRRVGLAKTGLGERGPRWWDEAVPARVSHALEALAELDRLAPPAKPGPGADARPSNGTGGGTPLDGADGGAGVNT